MSATLRLVHSLDRDWPALRRRLLLRDVRHAIDFALAEWENHGQPAALRCLTDHWAHLDRVYPADWQAIAEQAGLLEPLRPEWTA